eukprot:CAMPEP_0177701244 /NCGR_PEP_ID=MMETSP0484_2-20121128/6513_1 /TAXON_ID=354590 /ORGANISM="Rhodomonas lens, Strain RHODO" /LENGTH=56 /DNA_ID=CAMNT_0019212475 /DNA_START=98 /DNA_END=265 /DNA_ORIENTATION=-
MKKAEGFQGWTSSWRDHRLASSHHRSTSNTTISRRPVGPSSSVNTSDPPAPAPAPA